MLDEDEEYKKPILLLTLYDLTKKDSASLQNPLPLIQYSGDRT